MLPGFPAVFGPSDSHRTFRYVLWRAWDLTLPYLCVIGLNPSTAVECTCTDVKDYCKKHDDNTLRKCIKFAKRMEYGGLCMINLFAFRAKKPPVCFAAPDPIGPDNDRWLRECVAGAGMVIAAWGNDGARGGRSEQVRRMLDGIGPPMMCFTLNDTGEPAHPLYQPDDTIPVILPRLPAQISLDD